MQNNRGRSILRVYPINKGFVRAVQPTSPVRVAAAVLTIAKVAEAATAWCA
jgi:hypothetical protein